MTFDFSVKRNIRYIELIVKTDNVTASSGLLDEKGRLIWQKN